MSVPKSLLDIDAVFGARARDRAVRSSVGHGEYDSDLVKQELLVVKIRGHAHALADAIRANTPNCADMLTALEHVRLALFFAREAIELNEYTGE